MKSSPSNSTAARSALTRFRRASCPRCGYDLAGTVATWRDACPIHGRCNECGFEFDWHELFVISEHPWLFEYHWRRGPIRRIVTTIIMALRPYRFWRDVKLTDPVHLLPAIILAIGVVLMALIVGAGCEMLLGIFSRSWFSPERAFRLWLHLIWALPSGAPARVPGVLLAIFGMPIACLLLPTTLRQARVRWPHLMRIWLYSLVGPAIVVAVWSLALAVTHVLGTPPRWLAIAQWIPIRDAYRDPVLMMWRRLLFEIVAITLTLIWTHIWWWRAGRSYLRIRNAWLTSALLTILLWCAGMLLELL